MSNYIDAILSLLHSKDDKVRYTAAEVIEVVLKQGLYIPAKVGVGVSLFF